jgi:integrase
MTATTPSTALVTVQPVFTESERLALAGFLAGYRGLTREAYTLDLRQFSAWCRARSLPLFAGRRADIETCARDLETKGRARATVSRRLCTIAGFYKYAVEEELLDHSPAAHVRRPRLDYESHATVLARNELGAILVTAGLRPPAEHALISLLALNGLRISEATGADIEQLDLEARPPHPGHNPQGRQDRHYPARSAHRPGDRPGHRRAHRRAAVPRRRRAAAGPARRRPDRRPGHSPRRDHQARQPPPPETRIHHRRARREGSAARRPGGRLARRSAHHDAPAPAWPGTPLTSSPRLSPELHDSASAASGYVCPLDDAAESFVVGVVVAPDDVSAVMLACSLWLAWSVPSSVKYRNAVNCASMRFNQDEFVGV